MCSPWNPRHFVYFTLFETLCFCLSLPQLRIEKALLCFSLYLSNSWLFTELHDADPFIGRYKPFDWHSGDQAASRAKHWGEQKCFAQLSVV